MRKHQKYGKEMSLDEMKVVQMDVLTAIDEFCASNDICYSIACGTLLGAVRHKGYIPWDDDIDICIPRADYNRLLKIFPESYKDKYKIVSLDRDKEWDRPYAKAYDNQTVMIENAIQNKIIGVNIDIFPIDDVPDNDDEWLAYNRKRLHQQKLFELKYVRVNLNRSFMKNTALVLFRAITCCYSKRNWAQHLDHLAQKHNGKGYSRCFECCQGLFQKNPFSKSLFDKIVNIPFEDRYYKSFAEAETYLRNAYGNYMQLPPEEKRVSHHVFEAYWK